MHVLKAEFLFNLSAAFLELRVTCGMLQKMRDVTTTVKHIRLTRLNRKTKEM